MADQPGTTLDYTKLPLDKLRHLAEHGQDSATRSGASKELKARTEGAGAGRQSHAVVLAKSTYGTLQPELQVTTAGRIGPREVRAVLHGLAAQAEQMLLRTPELWAVEIRVDGPTSGALVVELMEGSEQEAARAQALLQAIKPAEISGKKRGRKPKSEQAAAPVPPPAAPAASTPTPTPEPAKQSKPKTNGAAATP